MAIAYADNIVPSGVQDGVNQTFSLPTAPNPGSSLKYYYNGILLDQGADYSLSGQTVVYALVAPSLSDTQVAFYRYVV